jgi:hypothetical protein
MLAPGGALGNSVSFNDFDLPVLVYLLTRQLLELLFEHQYDLCDPTRTWPSLHQILCSWPYSFIIKYIYLLLTMPLTPGVPNVIQGRHLAPQCDPKRIRPIPLRFARLHTHHRCIAACFRNDTGFIKFSLAIVEKNKFSFGGRRVCETKIRRRYLIGLCTYLSHLPIDRKAFSAPLWSVQQANCTVQPTASEGGDGTVSTVSIVGMHTSHPQCTRMDKRKCLARGGEECAPRMLQSPAPKACHWDSAPHVHRILTSRWLPHKMQTIGALIPDHVPHKAHAYTTPPVPQHPEWGTRI